MNTKKCIELLKQAIVQVTVNTYIEIGQADADKVFDLLEQVENELMEDEEEGMNKYLSWEYAKNPNDFNEMGIDINRIVSITYDNNHGCYVMFYWEYKN